MFWLAPQFRVIWESCRFLSEVPLSVLFTIWILQMQQEKFFRYIPQNISDTPSTFLGFLIAFVKKKRINCYLDHNWRSSLELKMEFRGSFFAIKIKKVFLKSSLVLVHNGYYLDLPSHSNTTTALQFMNETCDNFQKYFFDVVGELIQMNLQHIWNNMIRQTVRIHIIFFNNSFLGVTNRSERRVK